MGRSRIYNVRTHERPLKRVFIEQPFIFAVASPGDVVENLLWSRRRGDGRKCFISVDIITD